MSVLSLLRNLMAVVVYHLTSPPIPPLQPAALIIHYSPRPLRRKAA